MALSNFYWDQTQPADSLLIADIPQAFRHVIANTEDVIDNEHTALSTTSNSGGLHKQGSARAFFQASAPTTRIDTSAFTSADYGSIWFDSDDDYAAYVLTGHSPVTWTPLTTDIFKGAREFDSTLNIVGNLSVATNKFVVTAATGNTTIAGTATIGGAVQVGGKITNVTDPTEAQDAATLKYVTDRVGTTGILSLLNYTGLTAYQNSITLPNGMIVKFGKTDTIAGASGTTKTDITYATPFPNARDLVLLSVTKNASTNDSAFIWESTVNSSGANWDTKQGFTACIYNLGAPGGFANWLAIGY